MCTHTLSLPCEGRDVVFNRPSTVFCTVPTKWINQATCKGSEERRIENWQINTLSSRYAPSLRKGRITLNLLYACSLAFLQKGVSKGRPPGHNNDNSTLIIVPRLSLIEELRMLGVKSTLILEYSICSWFKFPSYCDNSKQVNFASPISNPVEC